MESESAQVNPEFTEIIRKFFEDWIIAFSYIFQSQNQQPEARIVDEQAVQEAEDAVMLSVIFGNKGTFSPPVKEYAPTLGSRFEGSSYLNLILKRPFDKQS